MENKSTRQTRSRYDRIAPVYDWMEAPVEQWAFAGWRERLWADVDGGRVLEVGVGTGKNMPYYPEHAQVTAVDLSEKMLARARQRAQSLGVDVELLLGDVQDLDFPDDTFDTAVATFVFCSVPDPLAGLTELARVVKPGGHVLFLEHVRINKPVVGPLMDALDPLTVHVMGVHINRRTAQNVAQAGLDIERVEDLTPSGLVKIIFARVPRDKG